MAIDLGLEKWTDGECWYGRGGWGSAVGADWEVEAAPAAVDGGVDVVMTERCVGTEVVRRPIIAISLPWDDVNERLDGRWVTYVERRWAYRAGDPFPKGADGSLTDEFGRQLGSGPNAHLYAAWAWTTGGKTIGVSMEVEGFAVVATAKVGGKLKVIVDRTPNGNWTITDLMRPGDERTFRVWVRVVDGTDEQASLRAIDPYVRWWKEEMKEDVEKSHWPGGRILGHYLAGGGPANSEERNWVKTGPTGNQKTVGECSGWGEVLDQIVMHHAGEQTVEEAVEKLKGWGVRMVMPWLAGGQREDYTNPASGLEAMPLRFRCREGLGQVLDWMKRNRMLVGLYQAYAWSRVPTDPTDWESVEESPSTGRYTYGTKEWHDSPPTDPAEFEVCEQTAASRRFARENYYRAARWFAALHLDAVLNREEVPWIGEEMEEMLRRNPELFVGAEPGPKTLGTLQAGWDYIIGDGSYPYRGPCAVKQAVYGDEHGTYHHVVQCQGNTDNETGRAAEFADSQGATVVTIGGVPRVDGEPVAVTERTFEHVGGKQAWENWFAGWIERKELKMSGNGYWERTSYGARDVYAAERELVRWRNTSKRGRRVGWASLLEGLGSVGSPTYTFRLYLKKADGTTMQLATVTKWWGGYGEQVFGNATVPQTLTEARGHQWVGVGEELWVTVQSDASDDTEVATTSWIYDGDAIETNLNVVKSTSGNMTVGAGGLKVRSGVAGYDRLMLVLVRLSGLATGAATLTLAQTVEDEGGTVVGLVKSMSVAKDPATATAWELGQYKVLALTEVMVPMDRELVTTVLSSNVGDTAVAMEVTYLELSLVQDGNLRRRRTFR